MIDFERLLDIQVHDTTAAQIRHRRATFPERDELVVLSDELATLDTAAAKTAERRADLARQEKRFEDEAQLIDDKASAERERMYSGEIKAPKDLQAMQADIDSLKRRQTELEDEAIALMEQIEPVDAELAEIESKRSKAQSTQADTEQRLSQGESDADAELATVDAERAALVDGFDADLLATYEKVKADQQGIAVSRLVGSICDGCHLGLSAVELDRVKHESPDVLVFHEECGRILVR